MQPFLTPALDGLELLEIMQNIAAYDAILDGALAQLTNLTVLQATHKIRLPHSILQVTHQLHSFSILLGANLGQNHALVNEYPSFVTNMAGILA